METSHLDRYIKAYGEDFEYAFDNNIMLNWYPRRIVKLTNNTDEVLELGIGHGFTTNFFATHYERYTVIDGSNSVIEQFNSQYPQSKAHIVSGYFEDYSSNRQFDIIIMGFVLEHVDDPVGILERFKTMLKPGGRCFIAVPNSESLHRRLGFEAGMLDDLAALGPGDIQLGHQRSYSVDTLTEQLESAGYQVVSKEGIFLKPCTTGQLVSLNLDEKILSAMCQVGIGYPELSAGLLFEASAEI